MKEEIKSKRSKKVKSAVENSDGDLTGALLKKALGYDYKEVVEEYVSGEEGEVKLSKKKVTKKNVPPDISAIKMLMENKTPVSDMSDEQLEQEKQRLLAMLKEQSKEK